MPQLSPVDQVLVTELQKNARITNRALAQAAGIAESTCLERVRALQQGVLRGFHASVNLEPLGRHVQALIAVRLQPKTRTAVEGFRDFIITRPETLALFVVSGSEYAGRLSGFDTRGSDWIYLATDLGPFVLTIFPGVWWMRRAARGTSSPTRSSWRAYPARW